jgi:peptide/nickel transport system ATP-binding protein
VPIIRSCDLAVARGERIGITGESGSGKTTVALAILGLLPRDTHLSGSIQLDGVELVGMPERELAKIRGNRVGIVFQEPLTALNPIRTVGRQMVEAARIHGVLRRSQTAQQATYTAHHTRGHTRGQTAGQIAGHAAVELAQRVGLPHPERIVHAYPHQLSGGERQRVTIAMALSCSPTILIADEPTTALDVTTQADILGLFTQLVDETGITLVFITHDLAVVSRVADQLVVMSSGRIVERGSVDTVLNRPAHAVTRRLVTAAHATSWEPANETGQKRADETAHM